MKAATLRPLPSYRFISPRDLRFGRGVAGDAAEILLKSGWRSIVLVHGADAARADWLADALRAGGADITPVSCPGEPDLPRLDRAVSTARAVAAQAVVALGGGSVIDMGKAIAALVPVDGAPLDYLEVVGKGLPLGAAPLPFAALPTTAGTGAEATKNAVIAVPEHRRKVSLRAEGMMPDLALVDPALTDGCPRGVTLASGLDAIVQVIEPYLSTRANPLTDALCRAAIPLGLAALARLMEAEDTDARDAMSHVSLSGGLALSNAGLGAVHGLAGVLGGVTGAAHGAICGTLLPHVLRANRATLRPNDPSLERFEQVAAWIDAGLPGSGDPFDKLERWAEAAGLPRLTALAPEGLDAPAVARDAMASSSMAGNPVKLRAEALEDILHNAR